MKIPTNWTFRDAGVALEFDAHVREQLPWYDVVSGAIAHIIRHYLPEGGVLYDVGASTGNIGRMTHELLTARSARLISVEPSAEMREQYNVPLPLGAQHELLSCPAEELMFESCDVVVFFLSLMFVPVRHRRAVVLRAWHALRPGGVMLIVDKEDPGAGYAGLVMRRLTLAGKRAAGATPEAIVSKELSLAGIQREVDVLSIGAALPPEARDLQRWFQFGEFGGWLLER